MLRAVVGGVLGAGGGNSSDRRGSGGAPVPPQRETNVATAARGRRLRSARVPERRGHPFRRGVRRVETNPPTPVTNDPMPAEDRVYEGGNEPSPSALTRTRPHRRAVSPRNAAAARGPARDGGRRGGRGPERLPPAIPPQHDRHAVRGRGRRVDTVPRCRRFTDRSFDAIRAFRASTSTRGVSSSRRSSSAARDPGEREERDLRPAIVVVR